MQTIENHIETIAKEHNYASASVKATALLLAEGGTVPFISRYRKEATGSLDEVAIATIRDRLEQLAELDKRRDAILKSLEERNLLTDELKASIEDAPNMARLEDLYLPYRPKRRTRATIAREKGLEPLADWLWAQETGDPEAQAGAFVNAEKGVESAEDALAGARDILAERISEDPEARAKLRAIFAEQGILQSKVVKDKEEAGAKFRDYFEWSEPVAKAPSHRILAMFRGENEGFITVSSQPNEALCLQALSQRFVQGSSPASQQVALAVDDGYKRLMGPSLENELRTELKKRADDEAIRVFTANLRELLLSPPLGQKNVLALDPGFRTGCKVVVLDRQGKLVYDGVVYPHTGERAAAEAAKVVAALCERFQIEAIAIGNGTAGRETEAFVRAIDIPTQPAVVIVNESGASVYSASDVAREEFPDKDVTVRGSVSIGRRLMDPLAELVKIDPKSIGVGQYQHDVDQGALKRSLDDTVMSCVNAVGVDVNTASKQILTYISGLGPQLAGNIVAFRNENGPFESRMQLKKVPRLGPKAFEQAAGFLRISGAKNPLDHSAVHPESYGVVETMAKDLDCTVVDLMQDDGRRTQIELKRYCTETVGLPTLQDIMAELAKPGRDPRKQFEAFQFVEGVNTMEDLKPGMKLPGIVTNVTAFGAFVDIGVHQDGLVHVSQLADRFVRDPNEIVKVQQQVTVTVVEVDIPRKRISLTMKAIPEPGAAPKPREAQTPREEPRPKPEKRAQRPEQRPQPQNRPRPDKPRPDTRKPPQRQEAPMNDWAQK